MVHVSNTMWRIKNRPSNSTSCSDNALRFVGSCGGHITLRTSRDVFVFNLGLHFEGLFWERYVLKGQITFEGYWRLQSRTLLTKGHFTHEPRAVTMTIVRAQKKVSKDHSPNIPPKSCSVVTNPQVWCEGICDWALNQILFQWTSSHADPHTW